MSSAQQNEGAHRERISTATSTTSIALPPEISSAAVYRFHSLLERQLRLPQPNPVQPTPGARVTAQRRADVVDRPPGSGLQDDRRLPSRRGAGIRNVFCCLRVHLPAAQAVLAGQTSPLHGSKFKAVNNRDRNFTPHKLAKRMQQVDAEHHSLHGCTRHRQPGWRRHVDAGPRRGSRGRFRVTRRVGTRAHLQVGVRDDLMLRALRGRERGSLIWRVLSIEAMNGAKTRYFSANPHER